MWDGHLGQVKIEKHHIKLTPENTKPIHSASYRAGPEARELGKAEVDKMLSQKAIEPAQIKLAA